MKTFAASILALAFVAGCQSAAAPEPASEPGPALAPLIEAAVSDQTRLADQVERDAGRKPAELIAFSGIQPGETIADIAVGGGYYTAILSRYLGDDGKIHAVDPARIFEAFPQAAEGFPNYIENDPRANVTYSVQELDAFEVSEPLDHILMVLYYHDTLWTGEDRDKMNAAFFDALKPGGSFLVVDHDGEPGAAAEIGKTLHRMDCTLISPEVTRAGFVLEASADFLENPDDPLTVSVFDPEWRGKTDRCVLKFRKPG